VLPLLPLVWQSFQDLTTDVVMAIAEQVAAIKATLQQAELLLRLGLLPASFSPKL